MRRLGTRVSNLTVQVSSFSKPVTLRVFPFSPVCWSCLSAKFLGDFFP